jgi:hypothetical protein
MLWLRLGVGLPFHGPGFTLYIKRWSRLAHADRASLPAPHADRASLPALIDTELLGIPTHAWEMATAQTLLNGSCWPAPCTQIRHSSSANLWLWPAYWLRIWPLLCGNNIKQQTPSLDSILFISFKQQRRVVEKMVQNVCNLVQYQ